MVVIRPGLYFKFFFWGGGGFPPWLSMLCHKKIPKSINKEAEHFIIVNLHYISILNLDESVSVETALW